MSFEIALKNYAIAIINAHGRYSTKKYHDKTVDIMNDMIPMICEVFSKLNPVIYSQLNQSNYVPVNDEVCEQYKKIKRTAVKKVTRTVNPYTNIFTPIIRKIVDPILDQWDMEEAGVNYKRPTSSNSIASKIYHNICGMKDKYTDTYHYDSKAPNGKNVGKIIATCTDPSQASVISQQYKYIVDQLTADKAEIDQALADVDETEIKKVLKELVKTYIESNWSVYSGISDYVMSFMDNYKEALRDMCIDKPQKKKKTPVQTPVLMPAVQTPIQMPAVQTPIMPTIQTPMMPAVQMPAVQNPIMPPQKPVEQPTPFPMNFNIPTIDTITPNFTPQTHTQRKPRVGKRTNM